MRVTIVCLLAALTVFAADDEWKKLNALKTGTELKIYEEGSSQPRLAKFSDATENNLLVIVKKTEVAIPKDAIDRVEYRPPKKGGPKVEQRTKMDDPAASSASGRDGTNVPVHTDSGLPGYSSTTSISSNGGEFQTIYRRPPPAQ
ncbi:MAG: hypothetical protein ACLPXM_19930 [Terriglobales bacterium]